MKRQWKQTLSTVLSLAMIFGMTGMNTVLAVEGTPPGVSALCEHHSEHTTDCGYTEGTPGTPCAHKVNGGEADREAPLGGEHSDECCKEVTKCVHKHTDDCYDDAEETASDSNSKEPVNCEHFCDEESGCITEKPDCRHEHDEDCGYAPAMPETPCDFVCEECGSKDTGNQTLPPVEDAVIQTITGFPGFDPENFTPFDTITVMEKATVGEIGLPDTLAVTLDGGDAVAEIPVEWETADGSDYEHAEYESYDFIPVWDGGDYELAAGLTEGDLPYITVRIAAVKNANIKDANALTELWVGSTQVVGGDNPVTSGDGWSYADGVLTLNDATINTVHGNADITPAVIYANNDLTIELAGGVSTIENFDAIYGILVTNNSSAILTVTGSGSLESNYVLYCDKIIIEDSPHVTIASGFGGPSFISLQESAIINGGTLVVKALDSDGQAMFNAPDLSGYPGVKVTASTDSSGTPAVVYNPDDIATYRYLKIEPGDSPTVSEFTAEALKTALEDTTAQTITLGANIELNEVVNMGADHTLVIPADFTLTTLFNSSLAYGQIRMDTHTLTINGGGTILVRSGSFAGLAGAPSGTLNLENITVNLLNTLSNGIQVKTVNVKNGATINLNGTGNSLIYMYDSSYTLNVHDGGKINIRNFTGRGISCWGTLNINGGEVIVGPGGDKNGGIWIEDSGSLNLTGGTLTGMGSGAVYLAEGATITSMNGKLSDRGMDFTATGKVTVGAENATASEADLSQGLYVWNGNLFSKGGGTVIGTMEVGGTTVSDLTQDANSTGWTWTAGTATLALTSNYDGTPIAINCQVTDTVNLTYTGDVSISTDTTDALFCDGSLVIAESGSGGILTLAYTGIDYYSTLIAFGSLTINSGTVNATSSGIAYDSYISAAIFASNGVTIGGNATVTANVTGANAHGIHTNNKNITISTTGTVTANGTGSCFALNMDNDYGRRQIDIASGTVNLTGNPVSEDFINVTGGTVNASDGTQPVYLVTLGGMDANAHITGMTSPAGYGFGRMTTTPDGKLSFWLPEGSQTVTLEADPNNYSTTINVETNHNNSATMTKLTDNAVISIAAIPGITPPVAGAAPVTAIETAEYTGEVLWWDSSYQPPGSTFEANTVYEAWIFLTPKPGYTLMGVPEDFFTVAGVSSLGSNAADSGNVIATFPATGSVGATTYVINITNGTASPTTAEQGATVTLTADAPQNRQRFKEWTMAPTVNFTDGTSKTSATAKFTMPGQAVTATATYETLPENTYSITVQNDGNGAANANVNSAAQGATITLTATPNSGYRFKEWKVVSGGVILSNPGSATTTFTMPANAVTITANWSYDSGGSSGGGGGSTSTVTPPAPDKPSAPTDAKTEIPGKVDASGNVTVNVPEKAVTDTVKAAQDAAKRAGTEKNGISVTVNVTTDKAASSITAALSKASVDALVTAGVTEVKIQSSTVGVTLDLATLKAAQAVAGGAITVSAAKQDVSKLSAAAQAAIGNRPAFSFILTSGGKPVTNFGGGTVTLAIPYPSQKGEDTGKLGIVYVDDNGGVTYLTDSSYDPNTKTMIARTGHFSVYGVGYKTDAPQFTDTANHWAKNDIDFVAARGLLSGTGNNQFNPNASMTRGMFVTALGRLAGMNPDSYKTGKFTDVKADAYYAPYVNWAADKGIVNGTSDTTFAPDQAVTRQEMAVIMANYAKAMGYTVPKTRTAAAFADNSSIESWAAEAVKSMQMAGVVSGKDGNRFDPTGTATRAEAAAVLHRYVELVIDPATAQGWTQNDVGQWLYYENGKPVTGWKLVDGKWYYLDTAGLMQAGGWKQIGGKWYYLYADGSMAASTKIDEFEVGADGARKEK